ncbi:MAG: hypothetical protein COS92_00140 [Desulfobacterales bacterium CG07_land_8_20_14_0_80_52_14]|nr:MAG: hypothetical protein COX20_08165 [Desulfobacterales bacterium CG23_combo_of_CG06-09_8_20_14_all_52_9]PIU50689.1 MAG: hypothetical protein COS92_00140 [Desulfobacterales bacterium CG07_land_8_20_14_0_80_52_14]
MGHLRLSLRVKNVTNFFFVLEVTKNLFANRIQMPCYHSFFVPCHVFYATAGLIPDGIGDKLARLAGIEGTDPFLEEKTPRLNLKGAYQMGKPVKVVIALFLLSLIGFFAYTHLKSWHREKLQADIDKERKEWVGKIEGLEKEVDNLKERIPYDIDQAAIEPEVADESEEAGSPPSSAQPKLSCEQLEQQITSFFAYLDQREYVAAHDVEGSSYDFFIQSVEALSKNPPMITGETDDLSTLIRNVTHFFRVLGKKRIELIIDIMKKESNRIEPIMETFYQWILIGAQCQGDLIHPPPLQVAYRYAGFFLNTLGGRSYLLRRDSRTRVLTSYYSILILDCSNDKVKNNVGIDIRPYIDFSFNDIKTQKSLRYQDRYLTHLKDLKQKYRI